MAILQEFGDNNSYYAYALGMTTWAKAYIDAMAAGANLSVPPINPAFPTIPTPPVPVTAPLPQMQPITWELPEQPPAFTGTLNVDDLLPAPFDENPPVLAFPTAPSPFSETTPEAPGLDYNFTYPTLSLALPTPPELLTMRTVTFSGITLPTTPEDPNELVLAEPTIVVYEPGAGYTSSLLTAMTSKIQQAVTDGDDTGLPADVENALWDRAREREYRAQADALDQLDQMEELGYSLPGGVFLDARTKIITETNATMVGLSREIMIKQAELHLDNVTRAIQNAIALESKQMDLWNQVEQRRFETAKYQTDAALAIYNAKVQAYSAYLDAYKTKAVIYEAQIRAEVSKVEAYKAEIEAERAKADINTALVQQYKVSADVALANVEIYKAELGAIQTRAEIEKTKIEIYGEQIRAYVGRVNAYTANVEAFKAQVSAEGTKQEAFRSQVQAYVAQVEAGAKAAEAQIREFEGNLKSYEHRWDAYKAIIQGEAAKAQAINAGNQTLAESFKAQVSANSAYNETLTKQWAAVVDQNERIAEVAINTAKMNAELLITTRQLSSDAAKIGAQVCAQLGAAALNAIHWSSSVSQSFSESISNSSSVSTSTSTNYNASI